MPRRVPRTAPPPPRGWYENPTVDWSGHPDADERGKWRYWDGDEWTGHVIHADPELGILGEQRPVTPPIQAHVDLRFCTACERNTLAVWGRDRVLFHICLWLGLFIYSGGIGLFVVSAATFSGGSVLLLALCFLPKRRYCGSSVCDGGHWAALKSLTAPPVISEP